MSSSDHCDASASPSTRPKFTYSRWRHGGWYVHGVRYPNGAIGCVSRNYPDGKWRIVCDPRPFEKRPTFQTRDAAAMAERRLAQAEVLESNGGTPRCCSQP